MSEQDTPKKRGGGRKSKYTPETVGSEENLFDEFLTWESSMPDDSIALELTDTIDTPFIFTTRHKKQVFINSEKQAALDKYIPELPAPDTCLWIISNGIGGSFKYDQSSVTQFEFGHFITTIANHLGHGAIAYLSTWTMNRYHAQNILSLLDTGQLSKCVLLTDPYWKRRESAVATALISGLIDRKQRYCAFPNHAKVLCMASQDETRSCVVFSSANFSAQPRAENFTMSTSPDLYHAAKMQFFETILGKASTNG